MKKGNAAIAVVMAGSMLFSTAAMASDFGKELKAAYENPEMEYRPEVRWWMAEGSHTDETLLEDMDRIYEEGFGAAEFLAMSVWGSKSETYGWGSDEWVNDTKLIIKSATEKGMGFSLTSGTNWGTANLPDTYTYNGEVISPDHPAMSKQLSYNTAVVKAGEQFEGEIAKNDFTELRINKQVLKEVVAVGMIDENTLDYNDAHVLTADDYTESENGITLKWTAPDTNAEYTVFAFWMHGTAETSDPSVSYNYTIDYLDSLGVEALIDYWENVVLTDDLKAMIKENGRGELYMDSLECNMISDTGGIFWTDTFEEEFEARRGYSIAPYIPFLINTTVGRSSNGLDYLYNNLTEAGYSESTELDKIRNDFFQTNTELYIEKVLEPLQTWLHSLDMTLRAEISYGGDFLEISQPGKYVDGIETESLEFATQIDSFRGLSGVAHLYNKTFSSETGAVMSGLMESFGDPTAGIYSGKFDRMNQILYTQFASGISRAVFHTYTSVWGPTEEMAQWPGYIGNQGTQWPERIGERQPSSEHYNAWTDMIARNQKALRQGTSRVDVAILRSDYTFNCNLSGLTYEDEDGFRAGKGLYYDIALQNAGYTYDYFSPSLLSNTDEEGNPDIVYENGLIQPDGPGYKAVIVYQDEMPLEGAEVLLSWAEAGLPVIFVDNVSTLGRAYGYGGGATTVTNTEAASRVLYNNAGDEDAEAKLAKIVQKMKALDNVVTLDGTEATVETLRELGVAPRADFAEPNDKILTNMRLDEENQVLYLYVYNYQPGHLNMINDSAIGEKFTAELSIEAAGKPYRMNTWTGEVDELGSYLVEDGRTNLALSLAPGESAVLVLDMAAEEGVHAVSSDADDVLITDDGVEVYAFASGSYTTALSDGSTVKSEITVPESIALENWNVDIETWTKGDLITRTEKKDEYDHETTEYRYETVKETVSLGEVSELKPWSEMGVEVSGLGTYTTSFTLPEDWNEKNGAVLKLGSICRESASVIINDTEIVIPLESLEVDITDYVQPGTNSVTVEVSSSLQNSVKGEMLKEMHLLQNYGLIGENQILFYTHETIA